MSTSSSPTGLTGGRGELEVRIASALSELAPEGDWVRVELHAAVTVDGHQLRLTNLMRDRITTAPDPSTLDPEVLRRLRQELARLRQVMYSDGQGTWFSIRLGLNSRGGYSVAYNFHCEPEWHPPLSAGSWLRDFEAFPRDVFHLPSWLRGHLVAAQPDRRIGNAVIEGPMDAADQSKLLDVICALLIDALPPGYSMYNLYYNALGDYTDFHSRFGDIFGRTTDWAPPAGLLELMNKLREGMYRPGMGAWFGAYLRLDYISHLDIRLNWLDEPDWEGPTAPPQSAYQRELERFPREQGAIPDWLAAKSTQAGPVLRLAKPYDSVMTVPNYLNGLARFDLRPRLSAEEYAAVLSYLEQAPVVSTLEGREPDRLVHDLPDAIPRRFRTDGSWVWPEDVNYYVREHKRAPQRPFVEHMRTLGYRFPAVDAAAAQATVALIEQACRKRS